MSADKQRDNSKGFTGNSDTYSRGEQALQEAIDWFLEHNLIKKYCKLDNN